MATAASYALYMLEQENSSLKTLQTSLDEPSELQLRQYVERQLKRLLSQSGFVITTQLSESSPASMCYLSTLDGMQESQICKQKFIVCFVDNDVEKHLDSFRTELDAYVKVLEASLVNFNTDTETLPKETTSILQSWYTECVHYINRCVKKFGDDLAVIIHAALFNTSIKINVSTESNDNTQLSTDLERFLMAGSVTRLIYTDNVQEASTESNNSSELFDTKDLHLTLQESSYQFSSKVANKACTNWAEIILKDESSSSFKLRQHLEDIKLKTVQDMNILKRIITQAHRSYYDLYRACIYLTKCGNADVILKHLYNGSTNDNDENTKDVIIILKETYSNNEVMDNN